jgi:macrolide transport system ATP-binding/permease protein
MSAVWQDVRYAARMLRRFPGFTTAAVLTLALGIGAATAIAGLAHALFLKPLAVFEPGSLVAVEQTIATQKEQLGFSLSFSDYLYYRENNRVFSDLAAHYPTAPFHVTDRQDASMVYGAVVTGNYFTLLGLRPEHGRFFGPAEDQVRERDRVAVISHELFERRYAAAPATIGSPITINGQSFAIVGVAPKGFAGAQPGVLRNDIWIPSAMFRTGYRPCDAFQRTCRVVTLLGRLQPGQSVADAQAQMDVLARQLEISNPDVNKGRGVRVRPARGVRLQEQAAYAQSTKLLGATVVLVLLGACANVSGLLLARGRRKEIALRLALGSGRRRLVRQLLIESLLLALIGGGAGLVVAGWMNRLLTAFYGITYTGGRTDFELGLDPALLAVAFTLSVVTTLLFGLVPALQSSRADVAPVLKSEGPGTGTPRSRLRDALTVFQMALTAVLLIGAMLLVRSVRQLNRGPAFDVDHVAVLRLSPSLIGYDLEKSRSFHHQVLEKVEAQPGVLSASPADLLPLPGWGQTLPVSPAGDPDMKIPSGVQRVGPRYFATLDVPIVEGRDFDDRDGPGSPLTVILNQALAARLSPKASALGLNVLIDGTPHEIVGVTRDAQYLSIAEEARPFAFVNYWQESAIGGQASDSRLHVRVSGDPRAVLAPLQRLIATVDPAVPVSEAQALSDRAAFSFRTVTGISTMLMWLGGVAVLLGTVGLYSVLSFTVSQRSRELAIRVALGATQTRIARLVVVRGAWLAGIGVVIGLAGAAFATRMLASFLYGVQTFDAVTFALVPAGLILIALGASYIPARRAARVDPTAAFRLE